jgi:flagellar basal body rod protein FlgG
MRSLNIAATGMQAQQTNVEVISNNIANMNTTAYTRRRPEFTDLLYQNLRRVGSQSSDTGTIVPTGIQLGLGCRLSHHRTGQPRKHRQHPGYRGAGPWLFPGPAALG